MVSLNRGPCVYAIYRYINRRSRVDPCCPDPERPFFCFSEATPDPMSGEINACFMITRFGTQGYFPITSLSDSKFNILPSLDPFPEFGLFMVLCDVVILLYERNCLPNLNLIRLNKRSHPLTGPQPVRYSSIDFNEENRVSTASTLPHAHRHP